MAYPEPTPEIKKKNSIEFRQRLDDFQLSDSQRQYFKEAFAAFKRPEKSLPKK